MNEFFLSLMLLGSVSASGTMPFWAYANRFDLMPRSPGYTALLRTGMNYGGDADFQYHWALSAGLRNDKYDTPSFIPDEIYAGVKWKKLALDLGMRHPELDFIGSSPSLGSLSVTGGNITMSGNARSMPGYCITLYPADFPFTKGHLQVAARFADYAMTDIRFEGKTLVHNTALYLTGNVWRFSLTLGLDHWAQWDGSNLSNYFRTILAKNAGKDGTLSDQMNVIGNHLGSERIAIAYKGNGWRAEFRHDIPFEDKSGLLFKNFPDGVNTLSLSFEEKDRWVSDVVYEYHYTMFQSGPIHDPETDEQGRFIPWRPGLNYDGGDNYFNNGERPSGWTHFGMTAGTPLFFPTGTLSGSWPGANKAVRGVENNRIKAHHAGLSGKLFRKIPYRLMITYTQCFGTYGKPYAGESAWGKPWGSVRETPLEQFSAGFDCEIPLFKSRITLLPGLYADKGKVLKDSFAATLGLKLNLLPWK